MWQVSSPVSPAPGPAVTSQASRPPCANDSAVTVASSA